MFFRTLTLIALGLLSGCVTVYQPLQTLQRPVVVDTEQANFEGLRVQVRCPPGQFSKGGDAQRLCRKVQHAFTNQGALTEPGTAATKPDLIIDLESRLLNFETDRLMSVLCVLSLTLIPWVSDTSIASDVTIRDGDGFVLASDSLHARFVNYFGLAVWASNALIDLIFREPEERLTGNAPKEEISRDFYSQISQLALHARTRALVLRHFESAK